MEDLAACGRGHGLVDQHSGITEAISANELRHVTGGLGAQRVELDVSLDHGRAFLRFEAGHKAVEDLAVCGRRQGLINQHSGIIEASLPTTP